MRGWEIPPPREPSKGFRRLQQERRAKVDALLQTGYLRSERIKNALLRVPREECIPRFYRDYAYDEVPLPLPKVAFLAEQPRTFRSGVAQRPLR